MRAAGTATALAIHVLLAACQSGASAGVACARGSECASPLVCRLERCRVECAANRDCPAGARCFVGASGVGACSLDVDERCGAAGNACPTGLLCLGGRCVETCTSPADCPADGECRATSGIGFCYAPPRDDAGVAQDAADDSAVVLPGQDAGPPTCDGHECGTAIDVCMATNAGCAIRASDRGVVCWGSDASGVLGDGPSLGAPSTHPACPVAVGGVGCATPLRVVDDTTGAPLIADQLACEGHTICASRLDGSVVCWGSSFDYSGGVPSGTSYRATPVPGLPAGDAARALYAGDGFACAMLASGAVWCWGDDAYAQLGVGSMASSGRAPGHVGSWDGARLAAGLWTLCAIRPAGDVACVGANQFGLLGPAGTTGMSSATAVTIPFAHTPSALEVGERCSFALVDGALWSWGTGTYGCLGRSTAVPLDSTPALVGAGPYEIVWAHGEDGRACARRTDGEVDCWGVLVGGCELSACDRPVRVPRYAGAQRIAFRDSSECAILAGGTLACHGTNDYLELGREGLASDVPSPVCIVDACLR